MGLIRKVRDDGLVHEAGATRPVILGLRIRQHGDEGEVLVLLLPLSRQVRQIEVDERAVGTL